MLAQRVFLCATAVAWCACQTNQAQSGVSIRSVFRAAGESFRPAPPGSVIACFGDSLTAGYGLASAESYPAVLQRELEQRGYSYRVVNLGRSGDTTHDGIRRMDQVLAAHPSVVVLEFGANDALRGLPAAGAEANLASMIETFQNAGAQVVLGGMILPPSLSPAYIPRFNAIYRELESKYGVILIPFFLEGAGGRPEFMQPDSLHPNAKGARRVAANVIGALDPLLAK